jgi:hypothetical protein
MRNIDSNCHYLSRFRSREELLGKSVVGVLGGEKIKRVLAVNIIREVTCVLGIQISISIPTSTTCAAGMQK